MFSQLQCPEWRSQYVDQVSLEDLCERLEAMGRAACVDDESWLAKRKENFNKECTGPMLLAAMRDLCTVCELSACVMCYVLFFCVCCSVFLRAFERARVLYVCCMRFVYVLYKL